MKKITLEQATNTLHHYFITRFFDDFGKKTGSVIDVRKTEKFTANQETKAWIELELENGQIITYNIKIK